MNKGLLAVLAVLVVVSMIADPSEALLRAGRRDSIYKKTDDQSVEDFYVRMALARAARGYNRRRFHTAQLQDEVLSFEFLSWNS